MKVEFDVKMGIIVGLILYSSIQPRLPQFVAERLLKNMFFKGCMIGLIIFGYQYDPKIGLLLGIAYLSTLIKRYEQVVNDGFITGIKEGLIDDDISDDIKSLDSGLENAIVQD